MTKARTPMQLCWAQTNRLAIGMDFRWGVGLSTTSPIKKNEIGMVFLKNHPASVPAAPRQRPGTAPATPRQRLDNASTTPPDNTRDNARRALSQEPVITYTKVITLRGRVTTLRGRCHRHP